MQPPIVSGHEQLPFGAFADGQVDRPGRTRRQRNGHHLAALAGDGQGPVPALEPKCSMSAPVAELVAGRSFLAEKTS